jgi:DNA-binding transcriptional LysR family regulator
MDLDAIDSELLHTFRVVVDAGRISAAARALHLSQPAVSQQIHKLEDRCGRPLLTRSARGVTPTEAGTLLLGYARRVQALLEDAAAELSAVERLAGRLKISASTTLAFYILPSVLATFRARHPAVAVELLVGNTRHVVEHVRSGEVSVGLIEGPGRVPHLHVEHFLDDEILPCVAGVDSRLRHAVPRTIAELAQVPLILRESGSGTRAVVDDALHKAGLSARRDAADLELGGTEAIKGAVEAGLGVAFLSRASIAKELQLGTLRPIEIRNLRITRAFRWALPSAATPTGLAGQFYRFANG